jgi:hypothetical protein
VSHQYDVHPPITERLKKAESIGRLSSHPSFTIQQIESPLNNYLASQPEQAQKLSRRPR